MSCFACLENFEYIRTPKYNKPLHTIRTNNNNQTDADLWGRLKNGDEKVFEQIYNLYVDDLYQFGKSLTKSQALVKDCIQDVFVDLWHYRAKLASDVRIKFYLLRSLSNKIQRKLGQETKIKKHELGFFFAKETFQSSIEDELVTGQEVGINQQKLDRALSGLPARQREVIHYVFYEKMTYEEVAKLMGIHIRSAYTLTWKAIKTLKKTLLLIMIKVFFIG